MLHTLLYFLALFSLSTAPNWARLSLMPVDVLGFWRLFIAAIVVALWVFVIKRQSLPRFEKKFLWVLLSGFFFFAHLWTYKFAAKNTSIANTMIFFATNPVWSTIGSVFLFKEGFTARIGLAYAFAVTGMVVLVAQQFSLQNVGFLGDLSAIASAVLFSAYILTGKKARNYYSNSIYASFQYGISAVLFFGVVLLSGNSLMGHSALSWIAVLGLVIFTTLLGHLSFSYLMNFMNLSLMSCGKLMEPILASIMAYYLFGESLSRNAIVAFVLTAVALIILFVPAKRNPKNTV